MKFYLTDTKEEKEITIKNWNGSGYDPDCFYDLETNFPIEHKKIDGGDSYICTSKEYEELVTWWNEEVTAMNNGTVGELTDYTVFPDKNIKLFSN